MRVLLVTPTPPTPEGGASGRCTVGLVRGLIELGLTVQVLSPCFPWDDVEIRDALPVELVHLPERPLRRIRWDRLASPGGVFAHGPFAERLRVLAADVKVVHFVNSETAAGLRLVDRPAIAQLDYITYRDRERAPIWTREGRAALELSRLERRARHRARWLLANSAEVAAALATAAPHASVAIAPLSLDPRYYERRARLEHPVAGLIGTARWPPTSNAVERLLLSVWPRIRQRLPQARLVLAGDGMARSTFAHLPEVPGVEWRGRVPSAADFLRELGVLLYPLTSGSGAKVKVLEALATGVPVVTTPDGAEGIGDVGGISIESDDARLAEAAAALLGSREVRRTAGDAAHQTFSRHHSPAYAGRQVVEVYERMTRTQSGRGTTGWVSLGRRSGRP